MTSDKTNKILYVSAFDYSENAIFECSLQFFNCKKLIVSDFQINYISFNIHDHNLYVVYFKLRTVNHCGHMHGFNVQPVAQSG